jgi:hypothetical protein
VKNYAIFDEFSVETLDCDDSFNELEDFGEISTIALPDDNNFVINNDEMVQDDGKEDLELTGDSSSKKDDDEMKLE